MYSRVRPPRSDDSFGTNLTVEPLFILFSLMVGTQKMSDYQIIQKKYGFGSTLILKNLNVNVKITWKIVQLWITGNNELAS